MKTITEGVHDVPAEQYHAHPALSASGAKLLLPPSCPAKYRYAMDNPRAPKRHFDLGHAVHKLVLGAGADLEIIDARDYKTAAAQQKRDAAYDAGRVPLLPKELTQVEAMAAAVKADLVAAALFDPDRGGKPEQSLFWTDRTGVPLRARLDWLPPSTGQRMVIPDLKSADSADPESVGRSLINYGYAGQAAFYEDGALALGLAESVAFLLVIVEKDPPYLVSLYYPDDTAMRVGRARNRQAMEIWRDCTESGIWPGYTQDIEPISLPGWVERQYEESE